MGIRGDLSWHLTLGQDHGDTLPARSGPVGVEH